MNKIAIFSMLSLALSTAACTGETATEAEVLVQPVTKGDDDSKTPSPDEKSAVANNPLYEGPVSTAVVNNPLYEGQ